MKQKTALIIALFAVALFFIGLYTDSYILRMITKPIPVLAMIFMLRPVTHYKKFVFLGLGFSVTGDFLLESSPDMFVFGLAAFLIAHLFYIGAFVKRNHNLKLFPLILLAAFGIVVLYLLYPTLGKMTIPVIAYLVVILVMCWRALAQNNYDEFAIYAAAGSIFFVISDSIIAFNKFYVEIPLARWMIMVTYWAAQSLIFYSAYKARED